MTGRLSAAELEEYRTHCSGMYGISDLLGHIAAQGEVIDAAVANAEAYDALVTATQNQYDATNLSKADKARLEAAVLDGAARIAEAGQAFTERLNDWRRST